MYVRKNIPLLQYYSNISTYLNFTSHIIIFFILYWVSNSYYQGRPVLYKIIYNNCNIIYKCIYVESFPFFNIFVRIFHVFKFFIFHQIIFSFHICFQAHSFLYETKTLNFTLFFHISLAFIHIA